MPTDYKFQGWLGLDPFSAKGKMVWQEFEPKPFDQAEDVDIQITHCGVCGSDLHTLRSGWGDTEYPICVGHEIVGVVVRVGSKITGVKINDRVGVGAQSYACQNRNGDCDVCADGFTPHCPHSVLTYSGTWPDGTKSKGGYGDYWRGNGNFVFKIPDELSSEHAACMLCAGVTVCKPLFERCASPNKRVGIIGIGGLGHFGILGAKALGCNEIVAISRSSAKKQDALEMGATKFIATDEDENWVNKHRASLDIIVSTVSSHQLPLEEYLELLGVRGSFVQVGEPEDRLPGFSAASLIGKSCNIAGSQLGSQGDINKMLDLFVEKGVRPWTKTYSMQNANQALEDFEKALPRYRFVLVNEKHVR